MNTVTKVILAGVLSVGFIASSSAAIYIENLPSSTTESDLKTLFSNHGKVMKVKLVKDNKTGLPKGQGFVHMGNFSMEQEAINRLNNQKVDGKKIKLSKSSSRSLADGVLRP